MADSLFTKDLKINTSTQVGNFYYTMPRCIKSGKL